MVNPKLRDELNTKFCQAILKLNTLEECFQFFEDICTPAELKSLSQRLEVAKMLMENKTYDEIENETGVSSATISRVKRAFYYGADGYKMILSRLEDK